MVDAAKTGTWDIALHGIDPARAGEISFTAAYPEIEATYLVRGASPLSRQRFCGSGLGCVDTTRTFTYRAPAG